MGRPDCFLLARSSRDDFLLARSSRDGWAWHGTASCRLGVAWHCRLPALTHTDGLLMAGRDIGWESMLEKQADLWPVGGRARARPLCWDVSCNLGNAEHIDKDGARSYARWMCVGGGVAMQSKSWWLLFPRHGIAVRLRHGVWVSWHGPTMPHCTAVPEVAEGEQLLSLFTSLPQDVCSVFARMGELWDGLRARSEPVLESVSRPSLGHFDLPRGPLPRKSGCGDKVSVGLGRRTMFTVGDAVSMRVSPEMPARVKSGGKSAKRRWMDQNSKRADGVVVEVSERRVCVRHTGARGKGHVHEGDHQWAQNNVVKL